MDSFIEVFSFIFWQLGVNKEHDYVNDLGLINTLLGKGYVQALIYFPPSTATAHSGNAYMGPTFVCPMKLVSCLEFRFSTRGSDMIINYDLITVMIDIHVINKWCIGLSVVRDQSGINMNPIWNPDIRLLRFFFSVGWLIGYNHSNWMPIFTSSKLRKLRVSAHQFTTVV